MLIRWARSGNVFTYDATVQRVELTEIPESVLRKIPMRKAWGLSEPGRVNQVTASPSSRGLISAGSSPSAGSPGKGVEETKRNAAHKAQTEDPS